MERPSAEPRATKTLGAVQRRSSLGLQNTLGLQDALGLQSTLGNRGVRTWLASLRPDSTDSAEGERMRERNGKVGSRTMVDAANEAAPPVPGRQSLVQQSIAHAPADAPPARAEPAEPAGPMPELPSYASIQRMFANKIQARATTGAAPDVHAAAAQGISGPAGALPHLEQIQQSFGKHDVGHIQAHTGAEAAAGAKAMGADAFATGDHVAFAGAPSLHIAAHEAAHVVQQRGGVQLAGGVGKVGDTYEQHADAVADMVVQGKSAESLLDQHAGRGAASAPVQRKESEAPLGAEFPTPGTKLTPDDVAEFIARRPELREDILEWAERAGGAAYVQEVLAAERTLAAAAPRPTRAAATPPPPASSTGPATGASQATAPAPHAANSSSTATASTEHAATSPAAVLASQFTTASGNAINKTTVKEAEVLNKLRREPRRFDPVWLTTAQHNLGVVDATGAMNTETLRAMRTRANKPTLDAAGIMDETFLRSIAPGTPFHEGTEVGTLAHNQPPAAGATSPKDLTAQDMGYASFAAYRESWGDDPVTFLGSNLRTPAHPYLRARIRVAETYLRNRVKAPDGTTLNDAGVRRAISWNGEGNASYSHQPTDTATHQHAMGLAIDIDPGRNPYFFDHSIANADFWVGFFEQLFRHATKLYGGEPLTAATLFQWSKESSTEELFPRVKAASQSFAQLLALSARGHSDESPTGEISRALAQVGYAGDALKTAVHEVAVADHHFHQQRSRADAQGATNLTQELVIALRDVAGLAWGGAEMSSIENADFMHFDCRLTDFGNSVYQAGRSHRPRH